MAARPITVRPYRAEDRGAVLLILQAVAESNPGQYPFRIDRNPDALLEWLEARNADGRFVAERDDMVVGHVRVTAPSPLIERFLRDLGERPDDYLEVGRLFADPFLPRAGIGRTLIRHAMAVIHATGREAVLLVPEHQTAALAFYDAEGWQSLGVRSLEVRGADMGARFMRAPSRAIEPLSSWR